MENILEAKVQLEQRIQVMQKREKYMLDFMVKTRNRQEVIKRELDKKWEAEKKDLAP